MQHALAQTLARLLESYQGTDQFVIDHRIAPGVMTGFHEWTDGNHAEGAFLVRPHRGDAIWLVLVDAKGTGNYYLMLYPESPAGSTAEIHIQNDRNRESTLEWKYVAKKRDGKNAQRIAYFADVFLSCEVVISTPQRADQIDDFLSELVSLAECVIKSGSLDENRPLQRESFPEGKLKERLHLSRERNSNLVRCAKAEAYLRDGSLRCACCAFDFQQAYGELGEGFIEAHHTLPLSELHEDGGETRIEDLVLVCANCHRMLHRRRPWLGPNQLRELRNDC